MEIYELAPRKVKQAIVGYGAAQKFAVAKMVQRLLRLPEPERLMDILELDIETYSEVELKRANVYAYTEHPSFEVLKTYLAEVAGSDSYSGKRKLRGIGQIV